MVSFQQIHIHISFKQNSGERFRATWSSCRYMSVSPFCTRPWNNREKRIIQKLREPTIHCIRKQQTQFYWVRDFICSPEPLAHGEQLWSLYVRRVLLLHMTSPPTTGWIFTKLSRNDPLYGPLYKIVQMVQVHCMSRSHMLKIDFQDEIFSETTRPRALIFGM